MNHVLSGEINQAGKATGYHAELAAAGAARIVPGAMITQNANGTYEAPVQIWDQARKLWVNKATPGGVPRPSTFFPLTWSKARVSFEVSEAFKSKTMITESMWRGNSPSGIPIEGYTNPTRVTFYPKGTP